jgi:rhodanese-related sulfurtransferase
VFRPRAAALAVVAVLLLGASACGGDADAPAPTASTATAPAGHEPVSASDALDRIAECARVIDVRTHEEFATGHLDGALNLDAQEADFEERVAELPREAAYVVYCASGRRAAGAVQRMVDLGFTDVVNGGGYTDLAGK